MCGAGGEVRPEHHATPRSLEAASSQLVIHIHADGDDPFRVGDHPLVLMGFAPRHPKEWCVLFVSKVGETTILW